MSKEFFGCCKKCKTPFTSEKESLCGTCNTHRRKQCILCEVSLPFHSQKCRICFAPQDKSIFEQLPLKVCCSCGASILLSSEVCYSCESSQEVEDVQSQPPPKPPDTSSSQPTDQNDSLASNANFDESVPVIEQVTPIEESSEKLNNQSLVVTTPSSEQETISINVSIAGSADQTCEEGKDQTCEEGKDHNDEMISNQENGGQHGSQSSSQLMTNITSSASLIGGKKVDQPSDQENSSIKAASNESHNEVTQQPKPSESSKERPLEQGNVQLSSDTCSAHVTSPVSANAQPKEVSLTGTCLSFPYHQPEDEASKQSKNQLVSNNLTAMPDQLPPLSSSGSSFQPSSTLSYFDSSSTTCTSTSSTITSSIHSSTTFSAPVLSTPVPHSTIPLSTCISHDASVNSDQLLQVNKKKDDQVDSTKMASKSECTTKDTNHNKEMLSLPDTQIFGSQPKKCLDTNSSTNSNINFQAHTRKPEGDSLVVKNKPDSDGSSVTFDSNHNTTKCDTNENFEKDDEKYSTPSTSPDLSIDLRRSVMHHKELPGSSGRVDTQEEHLKGNKGTTLVPYQKPAADDSVLFAGRNSSSKTAKTPKQDSSITTITPCSWKEPPQGLIGSPSEMTTIVFHALLPLSLWEFDDTSHVFIQFGSNKLGSWQCDVGPCEINICSGIDDMCEVTLKVKMKSKIVSDGVPYKYCVYTPKTRPVKDAQYEHIVADYRSYPNEYNNRFIKVANSKDLHQYDTVIYRSLHTIENPEKKDKYFFGIRKVASSIVNILLGQSETSTADIKDVKLPTMIETRSYCLQVYLADVFKNLQSGCVTHVEELISHIVYVYDCLHLPLLHNGKTSLSSETREWKCNDLKHNLKRTLLAIAHDLNRSNGMASDKRMIVATVIVCCLRKIGFTDISQDETLNIFSLFTINFQFEKRECQELLSFVEMLKIGSLKTIFLEAATSYIVRFKTTEVNHHHLTLLFNFVSLMRFIEGHIKPFEYLDQSPQQIQWHLRDNVFSKIEPLIYKTMDKLQSEELKKLHSNLQNLFLIDPLLLPIFMDMCPFSKYKTLFKAVSPFYSVSNLAFNSQYPSFITNNAETIVELLSVIHSQVNCFFNDNKHEGVQQLNYAVQYLIEATRTKLLKPVPFPLIFTSMMSLYLKALSMALKSSKNPNILDKGLGFTNETVKNWVTGIIGGDMFGKDVTRSSGKYLLKQKDEFEVWQHIYLIPCPENLSQNWQYSLCSIVDKRLSKVPSHLKADILRFAENNQVHSLLLETIVDNLCQSLDDLIFSDGQSSTESLKKLQDSKHMTKIMGDILKKKYRNKDKLSIDDILEWEIWPGFIRIYVAQLAFHKEGLSDKDQEICHEAITIFNSVCTAVLDGSITYVLLCKLDTKRKEMQKLCEAIGPHLDAGKLIPLQSISFNDVISLLEVRLKEFETFQQTQKEIFTLFKYLNGSELIIPESTDDRLILADVSERPISSLCKTIDDKIVCHYFGFAAPLFPILSQFTCLAKTYHTNTFQKFWNSQVNQYKGKKLQCNDVVNLLWNPVFLKLRKFLHSLKTLTISLMRVEQLLQEYSGNHEKINTELLMLEEGVSMCLDQKIDTTWINSCVKRMLLYHSLHQTAAAAEIFLELKSVLALTGDFKVAEKLTDKFMSDVKDQTLQCINNDLVSTAEFLHDISSNPKKLECLTMFIDCHSIIEWIKSVTSDVQDLQHFVTIALATASAGEDDYTRDRLSNLRTVGSGFAKLIYSLPKSTNCMELVRCCTSLWDTLKREVALPRKLRDCNEQIEWYKSVKEMQGSVEKSSFGQMNNITKYGTYTIRSHSKGAQLKPSELIKMHLEQRDKPLAQQKYSLDELRDLESKLVLITGRESEERANVDYFLKVFNTVCHITDVLIQLLQHGHSKYMEWVLKFPCTLPCDRDEDLVDLLTDILNEMTNDLKEWQGEVAEARNQFYCLNYYTTQQLLLLRKELSHFTDHNYCGDLKPDVVALLQSLSKDISHLDLHIVVSHIREIFDNDEKEDSLKSDPSIDESYSPDTTPNESNREADSTASKLHSSSVSYYPHLTSSDLTEKQRVILDNLVQSFGFHEKLILLAFERVAKPDVEEAVEEWCNQHEDVYIFNEEEKSADVVDWPAEKIDSDENILWTPADYHSKELQFVKKKFAVTVREMVPVDREHPMVKDMLQSGYPLEQALEAVEKYPDNINKAMEYIDSLCDDVDGDEIFPETVLSSLERQQSTGSYAGDIEIVCDPSIKSFLTLEKLAKVLERLNCKYAASVTFERNFGEVLKKGEPNLIIVSPDNVLKTVLSLYMENKDLPLPTYEEVLICNESTTAEEVTLLWKRAMGDPNHFRLFCLVNAELLSYQVCDSAIKSLHDFSQGNTEYKLVIVCSNEDQDKSHIVAKLQLHKRPFSIIFKDTDFCQYLSNHFTNKSSSSNILASAVDPENSRVRVVSSTRAGMGKSLYIQRMKEELKHRRKSTHDISDVVIPFHGPKVTFDNIIQSLKEPFNIKQATNNQACIFHFDISPNVLRQVDSVLFSLLILRAASDSQGKIWRCHETHLYAVEVTILKEEEVFAKSSITLLNLLPKVECHSPNDVLNYLRTAREDTNIRTVDDIEFKSEQFQRVHQYLKRHSSNASLDTYTYVHNPEFITEKPAECLQLYLQYCGVKDPSWSELKHFIEFLNVQLKSCENSVFCNEQIVGDVMSGLKTFVVKFMIRMSKDFATSSLKGEVAMENKEVLINDEQLQVYEIDKRKRWEQSYHPYLFFNKDGTSITFVGFNVNRNGDIQDPNKGNVVIERRAMTPQLHTGLRHNQVDLSENYRSWNKVTMINKIGMVMGLEWSFDPDSSYVLTIDNVIKIMAIHMRFRCNIPVIIMGETGCGKTRLIRYMCNIAAQCCKNSGSEVQNMLIMKIHGGTTENEVIKIVEKAEGLASTNREKHGVDTVLFFDEANTSDAIGLIKEVMCDRRINGRSIKEDVKFIAACNPYRKHTTDMINKLESAGLGFFVKATETQQKLGKTPLRQLVYRVLDLPPSMRPLVYDFGQLNNATEKDYTFQIVNDRCNDIDEVKGQANVIQSVAHVLAWSQKYMRERNDECSFVSLRDVERAMLVFRHFCKQKDHFREKVSEKAEEDEQDIVQSDIARSLILAISVCYHARLQDRVEYETDVVQQFRSPLTVTGREQFCNEIRWCQDILLDNMKLGPNIARNAALRENVFMMAICIELRIPLFLVGKPGSSKSLAKSIVADSMIGRLSDNEFIRGFKEVHMFSYQCSQLSTPESVIEIFNTAKGFQKKEDVKNYVSVVVLDEVGLAEDSPNLPLKALHPLLEDGTEGADGKEQIIDRDKRVAFIGISNWALDPAKMNRGVMVTRGDPDVDELVLSAKGICSNEKDDPIKAKLHMYFQPLASAYKDICEKQDQKQKPFFGLRDFYSLIKMLYWMCKKSDRPLTDPQLQHAIKRNFGGLDASEIDTYGIFKHYFKDLEHKPDLRNVTDVNLMDILVPDNTPMGLIRKSLQTREVSWHGENRYLLFLTENYAALQVIKHYLHEEVGLREVGRGDDRAEGYSPEASLSLRSDDSLKARSMEHNMEPFVLFGSSFPKDREYTQVCRNINQIKICMETGRTVILLNLENLYESLYDLLNQYYIHHGDQRYVDLGLQTHRVKCRVHHNFKLILIAEKATVYRKFPTPLINRLEKHFVLSETVLLEWQKEVLKNLIEWIDRFSEISTDSKFTKQDAFIGYQSDTPASVIFQATHEIQQEGLLIESEVSDEIQEAVLECGKKILLQMASPEALIRLKSTLLDDEQKHLSQIYYFEQHHGSIVEFLNYHLPKTHNLSGLLIQITTHSHLLSKHEANELYRSLDTKNGGCHLLQEFDTEMNFSHKISPSFSDKEESLLIIQCDSGHLYGDLLACARYRIDDEREKNKLRHKTGEGITHVLFIVHLPRQIDATNSSFVGFQGGSWISAHIDDIRPPLESDLTLDDAQNAPISQLFYNGQFMIDEEMEIEHSTVIMKEDSDVIESEEEVMEENQSLARTQSDNEEEDITGNAVIYDDGLKVEDLEELSSDNIHENVADDVQDSISEKSDDVEVPASSIKQHSQCSRLYNCIQAAVASLIETGDSKKQTAAAMRVKILLKHIPQNPSFPLDTKTFYGALVKHVRSLLQEREKQLSDSEWVLKEALSGKKLQSGGTFQNVLSRKLDEVITPIFAAVLLFVDQYSNLNLLEHSNEHLKTLWHGIFSSEEVMHFSFQNYTLGMSISHQDTVPGTRQTLAAETEFDCEFPFFWLIKEAIESKWESVRSVSGDYRQNMHVRLCDMLHDDPVANILMRVPEEHWSELCLLYLNDVLKSVHSVPHLKASDEYEILKKALHALINGPDLSPHKSLLSFLAAVHVVYNEYQKEIMWFGQLTAQIPGILLQIAREDYCDCQYLKLPLHAVRVSISPDNLALPLSPDKRQYIHQRLIKLQLCQNSIDSILSLAPNNEFTQEIRITWQRVRAVQLFIEHVALKCSRDQDDERFITLVQYANRINVRLKCEFVKKEAILNVEKVLRTVEREAKSKLKFSGKMKEMVRECCKSYFMEVVSSLCFGQPTPPESDLISELLRIVITDQNKTKEFTYSEEEKADEIPVIRSFLLQLLLEHNMEEVKQHLSSYFVKAQHLIQNDHNLCLLCIQCLEDAIYKQHGQISLQMKVEKALSTIEKGKELISNSKTPYPGEVISLEYLEGVSMLRFSLTVTAELIHYQYSNNDTEGITYTHHSQLLLNEAKKYCSDDDINEDDTGPGVFLVKQLAKQYGVTFLTNLTSDATMQWVVPRSLRQSDHEDTHQVNDPFVIYDGYGKIQTILTDAVYGKDLTQLQATIQNLATTDVVPLLVGTYQVITGSAVFIAESKIISDAIKKEVLATIRQCKGVKRELLWIVQHLLEDTYYGRLEVMTLRPGMSPQNRLLTDLVIHVAIALQCTSNKLFAPFIQMISHPGDLKDCFLPTMPEDSLPIVRNAIGGGKFYECPRGHPYFVSECGKPVQQYTCPICHSRIGGQNHQLESTNRFARTTDITETGYALGQPHQRESIPSTERSLSVPACAIIRALMHSSLLWSACTNEHLMNDLLDLIKTPVVPNNVSMFFWQHLSHDIKMLSASLGKSEDDACLMMHLLLKNIATLNPRGGNATNLSSKEHRSEWEKSFHDSYIKPVLTNLDANLHEATALILNNKREERDRLFYVIHERVQTPPNVIVPHLWSYHSRITLKNVLQVLQAEKETYPILYEFLIQDRFLRATQYLPSIIKLQQQMYKMSHKKLDKKEATQWTIRDYLKGFKLQRGSQGENKRNQFQDNLNCVIKAWNLVKERLKDGRVHVDPNIIKSLSWDEKTPLSYLIPTLTGDGACTVALVGLLVEIHNDFLDKCHSQLKTKKKRNKMCKVPASQIQLCHLLDYEHQILSIVLSHCHYSLKHGKGHDVNYDFSALEKHIVDRFIHGKPYIQLEFPQVVYRKDVYTAEAFANIRKNVQPQKQLTVREQTDIVHELHSMKHLRECLDVVEIVIGFLSSGKSNSKTELKTYIKRVVRIDEKRFTSKKAMEYCTLGHILSLWETLSVQMAKCLTIRKQEAFDSFGEELMKSLSKDQVDMLMSYLKGIDIPPFLNLLYEFIETTVRHYESNGISIAWPLKDTLYVHLENSEREHLLPEDFQRKFPESIKVEQTVTVWKTIVIFQYDYEQKIA